MASVLQRRALRTLCPGSEVQITREVHGRTAADAYGDFDASWVRGLTAGFVEQVTPKYIVVGGIRFDRNTGVAWGEKKAIRPHPGTPHLRGEAQAALSSLRAIRLDGPGEITGSLTPARVKRLVAAAEALRREMESDTDLVEYDPSSKPPPRAKEST